MTPPPNIPTSRPLAIWELCLSCATHVHGNRSPTSAYALRVARILFGTAAHESGGFVHRRQMGFSYREDAGAWGFMQSESPTISTCIHRLDYNGALRRNAANWLFESGDAPLDWYLAFTGHGPTSRRALLHVTAFSARLSCLWARLTYFGDPDPVPESVEAQAACWGRVYNTREDDDKIEAWAAAYRRYLPVEAVAQEG